MGLRAGGAAERCSSVPAPRPGSRGPHPGHSSRVSREAPLLPGASGWGLGGWGAGALGGGGGGKGPQPLPVSAGLGGDTKVSRASPPTGQFRKSAFTFPFLGGGGAEEELFQGNSFPCM